MLNWQPRLNRDLKALIANEQLEPAGPERCNQLPEGHFHARGIGNCISDEDRHRVRMLIANEQR